MMKKTVDEKKHSILFDYVLPIVFLLAMIVVAASPDSSAGKSLVAFSPTLTYALLFLWSLRKR